MDTHITTLVKLADFENLVFDLWCFFRVIKFINFYRYFSAVTVNNGSSNRSSIIDGSGINEIVPVSHMDQIDGPPHGNYDLPPPPEVLTNNNFDGQSLSSNSVTVREF